MSVVVVTKSCLTLCDPIECSMPGSPLPFTIAQSLFKLMSTESVMPSNHLIFCRPLPLLSLIFPSIMVFSNESVLHISWPKYWNFSFSLSPSNDYSGLISFRIDWLDFLAVQGISGIFSSESVLCIRWPKHWSFSFNISPSNEYLGLISFRID